MRWDERQRAMLREIGIRLWEPQPDLVAESVFREAAEFFIGESAALRVQTHAVPPEKKLPPAAANRPRL